MFRSPGNLCGMEHIDLSLQFPDEDDLIRFRSTPKRTATWWFPLVALASLLVAGATVLA